MRSSKTSEQRKTPPIATTVAPGRSGLLHNLAQLRFVHVLLGKLGVYRVANAALRRFPVKKKLSGDGVIRLNSISSFVLAEEIFTKRAYDDALRGITVNTFADLGGNVGWFPCYLAERASRRDFLGLVIEADPELIPEITWHLEVNRLTNCQSVWGAVGCGDRDRVEFHINPASTQSSLNPFQADHPFPLKGRVRTISVPAVRLASEWGRRFPDQKIDLLKVDIEGAELSFLRCEIDFVRQNVRRIVCEWHSWLVPLDELRALLEANGFTFVQIAAADELGGVIIYDNSSDAA